VPQWESVLTDEMVRKRYTITAMVLGGLLVAGQPNVWHRVASQAKNFQQSFDVLKSAGNAISPFERLVFSLALAGAVDPADK
jgi:hypothetical protein